MDNLEAVDRKQKACLARIEGSLNPDEAILVSTGTSLETGSGAFVLQGVLAATTDRLVFYGLRAWTRSAETHSFPYTDITSLVFASVGSGLVDGMTVGEIAVNVDGRTYTCRPTGVVPPANEAETKLLAEVANRQIEAARVDLTSEDLDPPHAATSLLQQLYNLHQARVLSAEEFQLKKTEVLRRL